MQLKHLYILKVRQSTVLTSEFILYSFILYSLFFQKRYVDYRILTQWFIKFAMF